MGITACEEVLYTRILRQVGTARCAVPASAQARNELCQPWNLHRIRLADHMSGRPDVLIGRIRSPDTPVGS